MNKVWEEDINNLYSDFKEKEDRILFLQQELQRKNNIINELKKWLKEDEKMANFEVVRVKDILDKIKELEENK